MDEGDIPLSVAGRSRRHRHHHQFRQYWEQPSLPADAKCEGPYDHVMAFSFDMMHDTSTFTFHVTLKIDPSSNKWQCSAVCTSDDVQPDIENINIPDGTYLPIHSSFACIRDKVYEKVHETIVQQADFAGTLQNFLTQYLNKIPTSTPIGGGITFNFAPTALTFADATGGLAIGFNGTLSLGDVPTSGAEDTIVIPLPTPDPAHTAVIRVATNELQLAFFGLYTENMLSRRFDASSVPDQSFFNTNNYRDISPSFYHWAPGADIVLYLNADSWPTLPNIQGVWMVNNEALATAGITPQSDPDAYNRLEPLVQQHAIYTDTTELNEALKYRLTSDQFTRYGGKIVAAAATNALPVNANATARVCVVNLEGTEEEAFVVKRSSTFLGTTFAVNTVTASETGSHLLTFNFAETSSTNMQKSCKVPNMSPAEVSFVLNTLMLAVDHYVQDVGKKGIPIPTLEGFAINKAGVNFIPSMRKEAPYLDAIIEVVADLTVNPNSRLWRESA